MKKYSLSFFVFLSLGLALIVVGRLLFWTEPFGVVVDESTGMAIGERIHARGVLYDVALNRKPPLLYWTHQFFGGIYGYWNIHGLHVLGILISFSLALMAWSLAKSPAAFLLFSAYSSAFPRTFVGVNAEYFMMVPTVAACLVFLRAVRSTRPQFFLIFLATFLAAVGTLYKQYGSVIYAGLYLAWAAEDFWKAPDRKRSFLLHLKLAAGNVVALLCCYIPVCLYFYWNGVWENFLYWTVWDAIFYRKEVGLLEENTPSAVFPLLGMLAAWLPLWIIAAAGWWKNSFPSPRLPILFAGIGAFLTIFLSGRYYTHYFLPILFFLCVWAAPFAQEVWTKLRPRPWFRWSYVTAVLLPFLFFVPFNQGWLPVSAAGSFDQSVQAKMQRAADWLKENSEETDRIAVWGMAAQIYLMSERGAASRHIFADLVSGRLPGLSSPVSQPFPNAWEEYEEDLLAEAAWFIDTSGAKINDYGYFPPSRFPELQQLLDTHFQKMIEVEGIAIWRKKNDPSNEK